LDPNYKYSKWSYLILLGVLYSSVTFPGTHCRLPLLLTLQASHTHSLVLISFGFEAKTHDAVAYVLEVIFLLDLPINFHTGFFDAKKCEVETNLARIRYNYLSKW
jgi:hypothetical protein